MKLQSIEKTKELKPGFVRASAIFGKNMVLLFRVDKDVLLDNHHHPHIQFGYCFDGSFDFNVDGSRTIVERGMSYMIDADIPHSAVALTDYYSMDLKYITADDRVSESVAYDVMETTDEKDAYSVQEYKAAGKAIIRIDAKEGQAELKLNLVPEKQYCLLSGSTTGFKAAGDRFELEPMKIYALTGEEELELQIEHKGTTLFFVEV